MNTGFTIASITVRMFILLTEETFTDSLLNKSITFRSSSSKNLYSKISLNIYSFSMGNTLYFEFI